MPDLNSSDKYSQAVHDAVVWVAVALVVLGLAVAVFVDLEHQSPEWRLRRIYAVISNLHQLGSAASQYMLEHHVTHATYSDLVGPGPDKSLRDVSPVEGEDYHQMIIYNTMTQISVTTPDGTLVTYNL